MINREEFDRFRSIAYERAGISLNDGKQSLVEARVAKRLRALSIQSASEYLAYLEDASGQEELIHFLDAISTNYTFFFREPDHFDNLAEHIKDELAAGKRRFRLWSAASSTGEEPYSIAIVLRELFEGWGVDYKLLATDISTRVLNKALKGMYSAESVRNISRQRLLKHFTRLGQRDGDDEMWSVKQAVRDIVVFKRLNLAEPPFPMQGPLDVVFCRNVMIYFDRPVRQRLIQDIERLLKPGGLLIIGHTETLTGIQSSFKVLKPSVYMKQAR